MSRLPTRLVVSMASLLLATRGPAAVNFDREIRPILSENCFACHGPDEQARKAKLRLDLRDEALKPAKSGARAIVPKSSETSELVRRIHSADDDEIMPPRKTGKKLTPAQIETLSRWIQEGAGFARSWALVPPQWPARPKVKMRSWPRDEGDFFILARLEQEGLKPSPEASRVRWLRRVTYDLIGLPPTPEEVDAFLADAKTGAYERVAERLLASPHFGERVAVPWLDAARYADSYGYQSDQLCPTWPFRDWVVHAFNQNMPFDEFILEQLAGDLLPNPTRRQRLATAFNRLHRQTNEGGSIEEEWRVEYVSDRVHTFGTTFLGLTLECARCHDHKYDPITTRDYYSLSSFFNSIDEAGLYNDANRVPTPSLLLPTPEQDVAMQTTEAAWNAAVARLAELAQEREPAFLAWRQSLAPAPEPPGLLARFPLDEFVQTNRLVNLADTNALGTSAPANRLVPGKTGQSLEFTGDDPATVPAPGIDGFRPWDAYSVAFWLRLPRGLTNAVIFHRTDGTDVGFHGVELSLDQGRLFFVLKRFWPGNAIAVRSEEPLAAEDWTQVVVTYDGSNRAEGMHLFLNGKPLKAAILRNHLVRNPGNGGGGLSFGQRFRSAGLKGGRVDEVRIYRRALAAIEVADLFDGRALADAIAGGRTDALREYYLAAFDPAAAQARQTMHEAVQKYHAAREAVFETMVMEELPQARPTYVLARGQYDAPKSEERRVGRTTPAALPPLPAGAPTNRLGLARWLVQPDHPLTARVAVNRFWQLLFGRGLVTTMENFGVQGAPPTHPELLDYLARDFVDSGWDVKRTLRKLVLSATYRQDSAVSPLLQERDPENRLWARGPSHRLPAEMIRDTALAASGLLNRELGGPPVSPYQPGDLWRESNSMSPAYKQSVGESLYRRSLYTIWKRTAPMPNMLVFDAPSREVCVVKRSNTGTPQQAYVLLNDPQFVEAARVLAEHALRNGDASVEGRIRYTFRHLTGRLPEKEEMHLLEQALGEQQQMFAQEPERATKLLQTGARKVDGTPEPITLAAYTSLAQLILNLDATVWKR
jgi:hypothetical protein